MMETAIDHDIVAMLTYLGPIAKGEKSEPIVRQIPRVFIKNVWPDIAHHVQGVVERSDGRLSIDAITTQFLSGAWQLWVVWDGTYKASVATEIMTEATGMRLARVVFATGTDAKGWSHLVSDIEDWARAQGCVKLEMMTRKGWSRHLPDYKLTHVLLEKDLV